MKIVGTEVLGDIEAELTIDIPEQGEISRMLPGLPEGDIGRTTFEEQIGDLLDDDDQGSRTFQAVFIGDNIYFVWIEERKEWVGIEIGPGGKNPYGVDGLNARGPLKLNNESARIILETFNNNVIPLNRVLKTSPLILEKFADKTNE